MQNSRFYNSTRNVIFGMSNQIVNIFLNFLVRTVFIRYLSIEYLGVNGLFSNVLTLLTLADLGIGGAVAYSLYKPLADDNKELIKSLMNYFESLYIKIGLTIGFLGVLMTPFLNLFIHESTTLKSLELIYLLYIFDTIMSYFLAHKRIIIQSDQKNFEISKIGFFTNITKSIIQIVILILTSDFILFLIVKVIITFFDNFFVSIKANHLYPYLKNDNFKLLDKSTKNEIWKNVKALSIFKFGSTMLDGTDNLIISSFVGISSVGLLSNYTLIFGSVSLLLQQFTNAITGSIGNFIVKEEEERQEQLLFNITFVYFLFYGFSSVALFILINPFISLWIGKTYLLEVKDIFVLTLNWYIFGMMNPIWTFRSTLGLFTYGKYRPLFSAVMNVTISIALVLKFGLIGVLIGTTITRLLTNAWFDPFIVYKHGFKKSAIMYYAKQLKYIFIVLVIMLFMSFLVLLFPVVDIGDFIIQITICVTVIPLIIFVFNINSSELKYFSNLINNFVKRIKK